MSAVSGHEPARWTIDDDGELVFGPFPPPREDQPEWVSIHEVLSYEDEEGLAALVAAVRDADAHRHCNPDDTTTLAQARELASRIKALGNTTGYFPVQDCEILLDLLLAGGTD